MALTVSVVALAGCRVNAANPGVTERGDVDESPSSLTGAYSLVGWGEPVRMSPANSEWSIELPAGGWWDFSSDPFDNGLTPVEATYRTSRTPLETSQPYASIGIITIRPTETPKCPAYHIISPDGEQVSERLEDMQMGSLVAQVYRVTAPAADGSASGQFNVCLINDGVMYMIDAGARPTLAQVDLFKMLRTFRLED